MWEELSEGALGAVVIADTRRLETCFASVDFFERRDVPFVVAVNCFEGAHRYAPDEVREALSLSPETPVVLCDARDRASAKEVLLSLVNRVAERVAA